MGYNTKSTLWPIGNVSSEVKNLIDKFFSLMDDTSDGVGDQLAYEIFTDDGELAAPAGKATRSEGKTKIARTFPHIQDASSWLTHELLYKTEIRKCRKKAWDVVKERRHTVRQVFSYDQQATDLMLVGDVKMALTNGKYLAGDFAARILLEKGLDGDPKIKLYQVWAVRQPEGFIALLSIR